MQNYRYILQPYKGLKTRHACPKECRGKTFTRYIDSKTGRLLPSEYGKCNRANNCGYHLNPYTDGYAKMIWLKEKKDENWKTNQPKKRPQLAPVKPVPKPSFIPFDIFKKSLSKYDENSFFAYLNQLFGEEQTIKLINQFFIGTSKYWDGATVFWLVDENDKIAGGQVILFDENGNTKKEFRADGSKKRYNSWVHVAIRKSYQQQNIPLPKWLIEYIEHSPKFPCVFGLPQLKKQPITKPIAIVESSKTAVIASAYLPQYIWLAVGGLDYLNKKRLSSLAGRNITLFPDKGGFEKWSKKAAQFADFANVTVSDLLERKNAKQGADLADYLVKFPLSDFLPKPKKITTMPLDTTSQRTNPPTTIRLNEHGYPACWDA